MRYEEAKEGMRREKKYFARLTRNVSIKQRFLKGVSSQLNHVKTLMLRREESHTTTQWIHENCPIVCFV